jgi:YD repeat-containing protein
VQEHSLQLFAFQVIQVEELKLKHDWYKTPFFVAVIVFSTTRTGAAQINMPANQTGTPINTSSILHGADSVNTMGLGLSIDIPLFSLQERGRTFTWRYVYNSPTYNMTFSSVVTQPDTSGTWVIMPPRGGTRGDGPDNWRFVNPYSWYLAYDTSDPTECTTQLDLGATAQQTYVTMNNFRLVDPTGTAHPLGMQAHTYNSFSTDKLASDCSKQPASSMVSPTLDGSGTFVDLSSWYSVNPGSGNYFTLKDGTRYTFAPPVLGSQPFVGTVEIYPSASGQNAIKVEDSNGNLLQSDMMDRAGLTSSFTYQDSYGQQQQITLTNQTVNVQTSDCDLNTYTNNPCDEGGGSYTFPSSITLPNGQSYQFTYNQNGHGELLSMTLPTGAVISYTYQRIYSRGVATARGGTQYFKMGLATRTETVNGTSYEWTYQYSGTPDGSISVVTVTDPNGNCVVYKGAPVGNGRSPVEQLRSYYQGCGSGATLLKTVSTSYTTDLTGAPGQPGGAYNVRPTQVTTTLANGTSSVVQTDYETFIWNDVFGDALIGTRMNPTEVREYDNGASMPTRTTDYTYLHNTGSSSVPASTYTSLNIVGKVRQKTIYSGSSSGSPIQTVTYDYDSSPDGVASSGAVQRDTSYGNYGNATSSTITDNTAGVSYTTKVQYEDTGNIIKMTDPLQNVTQYSYSDSWSDSSCALPSGQQGHIYLTKITNAKQQNTQYTFNSCTGTLASFLDPNSETTSFQYDYLGRTLFANYADQGQKQFHYYDSQNYMVAQQLISSGMPMFSVVSSSSKLGRTYQTQTTGGPNSNGTTFQDTQYDGLDQVISVSNPYFTKADPTYGFTQYAYDGVGRKVTQLNPDGSTQKWCFNCLTHLASNNEDWVNFTDENGNTRQLTSDALGRLTSAFEPNGISATPSLETDYTYDVLNDLRSVTQKGGSGDTARVRGFVYDGFGRLTNATNPESGSIAYVYDGNNNVVQKTDARGVSTNYTYDALNRLLSKTYTNAPPGTLSNCYQYDLAGLSNGIGHLAAEWTQPGGCAVSPPTNYQSKRVFGAYDPVGRVLTEQQCAASYCTSTSVPPSPTANCPTLSSAAGLQYCYDLAGHLIAFSNGVTSQTAGAFPQQAILFSQMFDSAGRLAAVNSSWSDSTHPATLLSGPTYAPHNVLSNWLLGTSLWTARQYDDRLRVCNQQSAQQQTTAPQCQ